MRTDSLYFDYAAATPMDERVLVAMTPYFSEYFYNPSSPYAAALDVRVSYREAKETLARLIGATADELVMTAGATESINLAIGSFSGHKVCSSIEHDSVLNAVKRDDNYTIIDVNAKGRALPEIIAAAVTDETQIVSVALANHEIGTIQSIADIAATLHDIRNDRFERRITTPLYLHCDASQGFGLVDVHTARLGIDLLTLNAAKVYGPKQVGLLWIRPGVVIQPTIVGGSQESGLRSGTENVAGVIGFAAAAELAEKRRNAEVKRLTALRDALERKLVATLPSLIVSGDHRHRLANFLHISLPGIDAERLVFMLEMKGISVATGSACAANKGTRSHVLVAIGLKDDEADGSLRITFGRHTSEQSVDQLFDGLVEVVQKEAQRIGVRM